MSVLKKTFNAKYKVLTDDAGKPSGDVEFYCAIFGNVDLVGDRILPGAFTKSLESWRASGDPIPVVFSHTWDDPFAIIGYADPNKCVEDGKGLLIRAHLDIDTNPTALQVFKLMQRRIVKEASFAFDVAPGGEKRARDGANNLTELNILECGPCLKGANPLTDTVSVKSRSTDNMLANSYEEKQALLGLAVVEKFGNLGDWVSLHATYDDHAIARVETLGGKTRYFGVDYKFDPKAGAVTLGTPVEVQLKEITTMNMKAYAWPADEAPDGEDHIPLDTEGQVRAALNLAQNNWTFRGNRMDPAPTGEDAARVIRRILRAAEKFGIETELEAPKDAAPMATSETGAGAGNVQTTGQYGGVVEPDYLEGDDNKRAGRKWRYYTPGPYSPTDDDTVQCPQGHLNATDANFCDQCRAPLTATDTYEAEDHEDVRCPMCGSLNGPDARFCDQCGVYLVGRPDVKAGVKGIKAGARNSRADQERLQRAHDALVEAGAVCNPSEGVGAAEAVSGKGPHKEHLEAGDYGQDESKGTYRRDEDDVETKDAELAGDESGDEPAHPEHEARPEAPQGQHNGGADVPRGGIEEYNDAAAYSKRADFFLEMGDPITATDLLLKAVAAKGPNVGVTADVTYPADAGDDDESYDGSELDDGDDDEDQPLYGVQFKEQVDCPACDGAGETVVGERCPACDGTGKVPGKDLDPAGDEGPEHDDDEYGPSDEAEPYEPFQAQTRKSASAKRSDDGKTEEPARAKAEDLVADRERVKADLAELEKFLQ